MVLDFLDSRLILCHDTLILSTISPAFTCILLSLRMIRDIIKLLKLLNQYKKAQTTTPDLFVKTATRFPNKTAIICVNDGRKWTFRELNEYSNRVAHYFRGLGLKKGDVVALFVENSPEFMGLWMGLAKIGVVSALINFNIRQDGLAHCIGVSKAKAMVFSASLSDALGAVLPELDPALLDVCFSVCGDSTLPQAKCLDVELEGALPTEPPPLTDKAFDGRWRQWFVLHIMLSINRVGIV